MRRGVLKFRGFKPKTTPIPQGQAPTDQDFVPDFEQKGVDMRIGLDIANYSVSRALDRIVLVTADTDFLPAMKLARINGLQVVLVTLPNSRVANELRWHSDFNHTIGWPNP